jgi:hypothetical protein
MLYSYKSTRGEDRRFSADCLGQCAFGAGQLRLDESLCLGSAPPEEQNRYHGVLVHRFIKT